VLAAAELRQIFCSDEATSCASGESLTLRLPFGGPVIASDDELAMARKLYRAAAQTILGTSMLLCQSGRILARSDEPDTMPE
jgi:hypothetical protein